MILRMLYILHTHARKLNQALLLIDVAGIFGSIVCKYVCARRLLYTGRQAGTYIISTYNGKKYFLNLVTNTHSQTHIDRNMEKKLYKSFVFVWFESTQISLHFFSVIHRLFFSFPRQQPSAQKKSEREKQSQGKNRANDK